MKRFPSIKKNTEYRRIYQQGSSRAAGVLVMYVEDNGTDISRLGISASKRLGNSVVRHTFARRIREIFRKYNNSTVQGKNIIIVARSHAAEADFHKLEKDYVKLLQGHGIMKEN